MKPLRIGMVAGEASGDALGAELIGALRAQRPDAVFEGVAGERMRAAGCRALAEVEDLSVMGLAEVLGRLPSLLRLRRRLRRHFLATPPDLFVGIDAPDFNLGLERRLKRAGIRTAHYVSPSVWAWRRYRVRRIARSTDRVLTLFPFEADFYRAHGVDAEFTGHPLVDRIPAAPGRERARRLLGLAGAAPCIALLPGSRRSEVERLLPLFLETARHCVARRPGLRFVLPVAGPWLAASVRQVLRQGFGDVPLTVIDGRAHEAMAAADAVLLASGTATLECLLLERPMVVAYRLHPVTFHLIHPLLSTPWVALPNLLAARELVPEFLQGAARPAVLGDALLDALQGDEALLAAYRDIRAHLGRDAAATAARSLLALCAA